MRRAVSFSHFKWKLESNESWYEIGTHFNTNTKYETMKWLIIEWNCMHVWDFDLFLFFNWPCHTFGRLSTNRLPAYWKLGDLIEKYIRNCAASGLLLSSPKLWHDYYANHVLWWSMTFNDAKTHRKKNGEWLDDQPHRFDIDIYFGIQMIITMYDSSNNNNNKNIHKIMINCYWKNNYGAFVHFKTTA